ncbi:trehalose operon repressor [Bacillus sp. HMF5848]|uniref:trehalose operon repressor n=1 Tax=Bacillus sp. HMF5848 TaxID=2495421 RepID=UPI000F770BFA|nr:trehalose operon repressor [Bacillus sp. HMF5848]RSK29053.1 trehalose operon repressor [Bacillus sp. HMF5848]
MRNKYVTIYEDLCQQIKNGLLPANTKLPSENELATCYKTSRETIRKALHLLSQNGYIQKIQGKGSIVIDVRKFDFPVSGLVSFKELTNTLGQTSRTIVNEMSLEYAKEPMLSLLNVGKKDYVWKVIRTREIAGEKIILDKDYLLQSSVPTLTKSVCEDSIYDYLENELGLHISFAKKEITVEEPTTEDFELLDITGYHNIVVIRSFVYLDDATVFQYTESRHRPDKFKFVDFARRNPT